MGNVIIMSGCSGSGKGPIGKAVVTMPVGLLVRIITSCRAMVGITLILPS